MNNLGQCLSHEFGGPYEWTWPEVHLLHKVSDNSKSTDSHGVVTQQRSWKQTKFYGDQDICHLVFAINQPSDPTGPGCLSRTVEVYLFHHRC